MPASSIMVCMTQPPAASMRARSSGLQEAQIGAGVGELGRGRAGGRWAREEGESPSGHQQALLRLHSRTAPGPQSRRLVAALSAQPSIPRQMQAAAETAPRPPGRLVVRGEGAGNVALALAKAQHGAAVARPRRRHAAGGNEGRQKECNVKVAGAGHREQQRLLRCLAGAIRALARRPTHRPACCLLPPPLSAGRAPPPGS